MERGIVRFGFLISPPTINPTSQPKKAKNKIKEDSPSSLKVGNDSMCKLAIDTSFQPIKTRRSKGLSFNIVFNFTKPIPCLIPRTFIVAIIKYKQKRKVIRIHSISKLGLIVAKIFTKAIATAAFANIVLPIANIPAKKPAKSP